MSNARYIMIGGFLGAGKTTAVARLAQWLSAQGRRVGLITNDQGTGLVDTALLRARGFQTEEISGGCFCCRFNSLLDAARRLTAGARPEVFIAEPVGSCTDLVATVAYPLRRMYGTDYTVAPLSVLIDPIRAARILGLEPGGRFSEKVLYVYHKQLEEANLLVVNKADLLAQTRQQQLRAALVSKFPHKKILTVSARTGAGLDEWFALLASESQPGGESMSVDYETYARGEALLGWLNARVQALGKEEFDPNQLLGELATLMQTELSQQACEVAHLKMTINPEGGFGDIAGINVVRNDLVPELSLTLPGKIRSGQLIINLRAEADPDRLKSVVRDALAASAHRTPGLTLRIDHLEHFRPGKPQPTYRDLVSTGAGRESV